MSCAICRRGACTESFHSHEEQERHAAVQKLLSNSRHDADIAEQLYEAQLELIELKRQLEALQETPA